MCAVSGPPRGRLHEVPGYPRLRCASVDEEEDGGERRTGVSDGKREGREETERRRKNREIESALTNLSLTPYRYFHPVFDPCNRVPLSPFGPAYRAPSPSSSSSSSSSRRAIFSPDPESRAARSPRNDAERRIKHTGGVNAPL